MKLTGRGREEVLASLGVAGLALLLYANSLGGAFVFDDHAAIQVNPDVRSGTPLASVFTNDFWGLPLSDPESHKSYRPLTVLSFRLDHTLHGLWSPGFHAVNVAAHSLVCLLFLRVCRGFGAGLGPSLAAGLMFVAHPIHTEAVANIVGRSELLAAIFFLLSLTCHQRAVRASSNSILRSLAWVCCSVALAAISLLCKEQGITVLGLCLVNEVISVLKRRGFSRRQASRINKPTARLTRENSEGKCCYGVIARLSILIAATFGLLYVRIVSIGGGTPTFLDSDNPASFSPSRLTRSLTYAYLYAVNSWLLLCPSRLCHDWSMGSIPLVESMADSRNFTSLSLVTAVFVGLVTVTFKVLRSEKESDCRRQKPVSVESAALTLPINGNRNSNNSNNNNNSITTLQTNLTLLPTLSEKNPSRGRETPLGKKPPRGPRDRVPLPPGCFLPLSVIAATWTVLPFLPASNLFFPVGFVVAERVLYLPSMGFCLLVATGAHRIWKRRRRTGVVALSLLVVVFSAKTVARNADWATTDAIVRSALKVNPGNAKVHMSMGNELAQQGDRRCELFYRRALQLRPQYASAWANLGLILINTDRPHEAEEAYLTALHHKPDHINANSNMGHLCRLQGRWREARSYFEAALRRRHNVPSLHYLVGVVSEELGTERDIEIAAHEYELALQYSPTYWEAHHRLGRLLATKTASRNPNSQGAEGERLRKALYHYKKAAAIKPDDGEIQRALEDLLNKLNESKEAEKRIGMANSHLHNSQRTN